MNLNENVLEALEFFSKNSPPLLDMRRFNLPFVVGSGNAFNTGKIIFSDRSAIFADESNFKQIINSYEDIIKKGLINQAVIISASGEKDSVWEVELAKKHKLKTILLTCEPKSSAAQVADEVLAYRKISEPYTYNVSTYLGMVLSSTGERPNEIKERLLSLVIPDNFPSYSSYSFVLPDKFMEICPMIDIKESELFGPHLSIRAFSQGHARHAKFVIPWDKELVISIGEENKFFGHLENRWDVKADDSMGFAEMLCLTYYIVGKIQEIKKPYYKENIEAYCADYGPKAYGKDKPFEVIVPGN